MENIVFISKKRSLFFLQKNCVDVPTEFLPTFSPLNDLSSSNNNELE